MPVTERLLTAKYFSEDGRFVETSNDLRCDITLTKTMTGEENEGEIKHYNLNNSTLNFIASEAVKVEVTAGYVNENSVIYGGSVRRAQASGGANSKKSSGLNIGREGVDSIAKIAIGSDTLERLSFVVSKSFAGETSAKTIVEKILEDVGMSAYDLSLLEGRVRTDFVASGKASESISDIVNEYGFIWYNDFDLLHISVPGAANLSTVIKVDEDSGLLSSPEATEYGIKFNMLLIPGPQIERIVDVESVTNSTVNGRYKIRKLMYTGSNWDGDHKIEVEGAAI